ncbi:MAG: glucose-6-phosphate dehydrogenase [Chloroflexi bacterium]|nr:glucose-6-phosphate dehydrogenase [Chloroflexota bacterium]MDA1269831.1 glucose-6-phosphate dehydrogenase [Chloroflexota bacterium]PKB58482.1 MAG: glucose-6-phosphate dehydrogenase [SAR202 cluster bacterium Casp-Chloro-G2]
MTSDSGDQVPAQTTTIVIMGASGDLARRKLIPSLCSLFCKGRLGPEVRIVGMARTRQTEQQFRESLAEGMEEFAHFSPGSDAWDEFISRVGYCYGDVTSQDDLENLDETLRGIESPGQPANRLYYLALAPSLYGPAVLNLGATGMARETGCWRRVVIEKPFGSDLATAQELNQVVHSVFSESQVFRIDHYLGKETVQNLLVFRFANTIFEPIWSRSYIDNIQITVSETVPVSERAGYYDQAGVLRDMFQNHLLQLLTVVAMEPPSNFQADLLRNEKVKVLNAVRRPTLIEHGGTRGNHETSRIAVTGQYGGYLDEPGVPSGSRTPTYAAVRLDIDNWRWQGVPFYLRSGKALEDKRTEIIIQFRKPPHMMFAHEITANILAIQVQPHEGLHIEFQAKTPDEKMEMRPVDLEFHYEDSFGGMDLPDAYERLLLDAMNGDASLFTRSDEIEEAWEIIDPIIQSLPAPDHYNVGSRGPEAADDLLAKDGRRWLDPHSRF